MKPEEYVQRLLEISTKKYKLLEKMYDITKKQTDVITEDNYEQLEKLVSQKQKIIESINKIDEGFSVYFQRLKQELKINNLSELKNIKLEGIKQLQVSTSKIMGLMKEMVDLEKSNDEKAKALLKVFGDKIKNINKGKKMASAYKPVNPQKPSYFMDKKK